MHRIRLAHCSDIHLDGHNYVKGGSDAAREGLVAVLAAIRGHKPDLLLYAGDLFDHNRARAETIDWAKSQLAAQPFPIVMIPGNHDCLDPDGIFRRHDFSEIDNVTMLAAPDGETVDLPGLDVTVWGRGMLEHNAAFRPLGGLPSRPAGRRWFFGMGHGMYVPEGETTDRSSPIHYHEIAASECDYIALGHHHAALEIATPRAFAAFSGSPTDRLGRGASYIIADLVTGQMPAVTVHTI
jgi:exonuclease SbcD